MGFVQMTPSVPVQPSRGGTISSSLYWGRLTDWLRVSLADDGAGSEARAPTPQPELLVFPARIVLQNLDKTGEGENGPSIFEFFKIKS